MAVLTTQTISHTGLTTTFAAVAGGGDKFTPGDNTFIEIDNADSASHTITIDSKVPSNYGTDVNVGPITVAAGARIKIGPFPAQRFMGSDGYGDIAYSAATGMTIAVVSH